MSLWSRCRRTVWRFLNADDMYVRTFGDDMGERAVFYGTSDDAQVQATEIEEHGLSGSDFTLLLKPLEQWGGPEKVVLRLPGRHNVLNALAAFSVGTRSGVHSMEAMSALESLRPTARRGEEIEWHGARLINDTYNSNPIALRSMVQALRSAEAKRHIVVAGEMLELGPEGPELHRQCGRFMRGMGVVIGVRGLAAEIVAGARGRDVETLFVETPEEAGAWLRDNLREGDVVLLKASRGVRLERALEALA